MNQHPIEQLNQALLDRTQEVRMLARALREAQALINQHALNPKKGIEHRRPLRDWFREADRILRLLGPGVEDA